MCTGDQADLPTVCVTDLHSQHMKETEVSDYQQRNGEVAQMLMVSQHKNQRAESVMMTKMRKMRKMILWVLLVVWEQEVVVQVQADSVHPLSTSNRVEIQQK